MPKFPLALLSLSLLTGCALKYSPPDVDPQARVQFQDKFQAALYRSIASDVQDEMVGVAALRITVNRLGRAASCKAQRARPDLDKQLPIELTRTAPKAFARFIEERCLRAIYPTAPEGLYNEDGEVEVIAPVTVVFNNQSADRWKTGNAQRRFFREHLLDAEQVDSVGIAVIHFQTNGVGCLVDLRPNSTRPGDFKLDGALQGRLNAACSKLDLKQVPGIGVNPQTQEVGKVALEYAPWTSWR
ncbi:hypothetical protein ACX3YG_11300 [Pseudomonas wadenswilerensis]